MAPHQGLYSILEGSASALELEERVIEAGAAAGLIDDSLHLKVRGQHDKTPVLPKELSGQWLTDLKRP